MYTTEQRANKNTKNRAKKPVFRLGTTLVSPKHMKRGFTYKEVSLIAGILVAIIVVLTLWFKQWPEAQSMSGPSIPEGTLKSITHSMVEKVLSRIP